MPAKLKLIRQIYDIFGLLIDESTVIFMPGKQRDLFHSRSSWVGMTDFRFIWFSLGRSIFEMKSWDGLICQHYKAGSYPHNSSSLNLPSSSSWHMNLTDEDAIAWLFLHHTAEGQIVGKCLLLGISLSFLPGSNSNTHKRRLRANMLCHQI